ncbi:MAG: hypothetical protein IPM87_11400 [Novosphingobium sp.]|nr:hypothetical protein [Novosphingobium sp.]MBK9011264.1 hypothetical protein [Novosphingobium sp.]
MLALAGAALSVGAIAEAAPGDRLRDRIAAWRQARAAPPGPAVAAPAPMTLAYGADPLQQLDLWRPATRPAPHPASHLARRRWCCSSTAAGGAREQGQRGQPLGAAPFPRARLCLCCDRLPAGAANTV